MRMLFRALSVVLLGGVLLGGCVMGTSREVKEVATPTVEVTSDVVEEVVEERQWTGSMVPYLPGSEGTMGYLVYPESTLERAPALVIVHEWWGLNDHVKEMAHRLAEEGYVVLAVDMYEGKVATEPDEARAYATAVRENPEQAVVNTTAAVSYLQTLLGVDSERIGMVGWCFGGQWTFASAVEGLPIQAAVVYYGNVEPERVDPAMPMAMLGHFGAEDTSISLEIVDALEAALSSDDRHEVYVYEGAAHAFANEGGSNYNAAAAELSWTRTVEFLAEKL